MTGKSVIIDNNEQFLRSLHKLDKHSIVNCRLRLIPGEEHLLVDLLERGVTLIPSASSQLASRSKAHQARIFIDFMLPHTRVAYDANGLLETISRYNSADITEVVVKRDRKNGGIGIHRFRTIEEVYNHAAFGSLEYPIVVQPLIEHFRDIRVIVLGTYIEAYERVNHTNFRHNLHCGGSAASCELSEELLQFCRKVMERGKFPYAHIDLMQTPAGAIYLTEINLRGGLSGAKIRANRYREIINRLQAQLLADIVSSS